jgi:hypothetical protein
LTRIKCAFHEDLGKFMIMPRSILLGIKLSSGRFVEKVKSRITYSINFFSEIHAVYEMIWKNTVEPDRLQTTV